MKKLILLITLLNISNSLQSMDAGIDARDVKQYCKILLKELQCEQERLTHRQDQHKVLAYLIDRKKRVTSQQNSHWSRLYHFISNGMLPVAIGAWAAWGSYRLYKGSLLKQNSIMDVALIAPTLMGLTAISTVKGFESLYNNIFYWKERKEEKIKRTQELINQFNEDYDEGKEEEEDDDSDGSEEEDDEKEF